VYLEEHLVPMNLPPLKQILNEKKRRDLAPTFHKEEEGPYTYYLGM
jgi:hypothetical protein